MSLDDFIDKQANRASNRINSRKSLDTRDNRGARGNDDARARRFYEASTPAPLKPKPRPSVRPDASVLLQHQRNRAASGRGSGSARGTILTSVYRLGQGTAGRAVRSLQSFNGPRGERTLLGR